MNMGLMVVLSKRQKTILRSTTKFEIETIVHAPKFSLSLEPKLVAGRLAVSKKLGKIFALSETLNSLTV